MNCQERSILCQQKSKITTTISSHMDTPESSKPDDPHEQQDKKISKISVWLLTTAKDVYDHLDIKHQLVYCIKKEYIGTNEY
jgi:hypothetical protein